MGDVEERTAVDVSFVARLVVGASESALEAEVFLTHTVLGQPAAVVGLGLVHAFDGPSGTCTFAPVSMRLYARYAPTAAKPRDASSVSGAVGAACAIDFYALRRNDIGQTSRTLVGSATVPATPGPFSCPVALHAAQRYEKGRVDGTLTGLGLPPPATTAERIGRAAVLEDSGAVRVPARFEDEYSAFFARQRPSHIEVAGCRTPCFPSRVGHLPLWTWLFVEPSGVSSEAYFEGLLDIACWTRDVSAAQWMAAADDMLANGYRHADHDLVVYVLAAVARFCALQTAYIADAADLARVRVVDGAKLPSDVTQLASRLTHQQAQRSLQGTDYWTHSSAQRSGDCDDKARTALTQCLELVRGPWARRPCRLLQRLLGETYAPLYTLGVVSTAAAGSSDDAAPPANEEYRGCGTSWPAHLVLVLYPRADLTTKMRGAAPTSPPAATPMAPPVLVVEGTGLCYPILSTAPLTAWEQAARRAARPRGLVGAVGLRETPLEFGRRPAGMNFHPFYKMAVSALTTAFEADGALDVAFLALDGGLGVWFSDLAAGRFRVAPTRRHTPADIALYRELAGYARVPPTFGRPAAGGGPNASWTAAGARLADVHAPRPRGRLLQFLDRDIDDYMGFAAELRKARAVVLSAPWAAGQPAALYAVVPP